MKNYVKLAGIIAIVAIIGFSFAACGNGTTGGGQGDNVDHLLGIWECAELDVEFKMSQGNYENYFTSSDVGLHARVFVLNSDVITVGPNGKDGSFKVSLGNDRKLTVSDGTGKFASGFNGVYTEQPE